MFTVANLKQCTFVVFVVICMLFPNLSLLHLFNPLGYRIKFQLPFNNIKWLSDYSRRWQVKG